jgi:hypothetical protein
VTEAFHNTPSAPSPCLEGTREQLISDIFTWFNNPDPSGKHVFWLNGLAGTGKSAVARTVADHAQEQGRLAATFFFSRSLVVTRAPSAIIPTIVYQLARHLKSIRPLICAAVDFDPPSANSQISGALTVCSVWRQPARTPERQTSFFCGVGGWNPQPAAKHQVRYHSAIKIISVYKLQNL